MLLKRVSSSEAERVFVAFTANEANIAADDVVALDLTAASVNGNYIVQPNTGELFATVGIADAAIANGSVGLVQVYGYRSTSRVLQTGTSLTAGCALGPVAGSDMLQSQATVPIGYLPAFVLLESASSAPGADSTTSKKIWIRTM